MLTKYALSLLLIMLVFGGSCCWAQTEIAAGDWSATVGNLGPDEILYKGEVIARNGRLGGYLPEWKGTRFGMGASTLEVTDSSAVWTKSAPGNQDATLRLDLTAEGCKFSLASTIYAAGPSEFALQFVAEAVASSEGQAFVWLNGEAKVLPLRPDEAFERIGGINELRFERPERTLTVSCPGFEMQDRRAGRSGLYLVRVIGSPGEEPLIVERTIELRMDPAEPESIEGRRRLLSQPIITEQPVAVRNATFEGEEPLAFWAHGPTAAAETEVRRGGASSASLTLSEKDQNPYMTQNIPVKENQLYQVQVWIKTQNVENAIIGGRYGAGATVIMEFCDKQGKWMAPGSYAQGIYETRDWTLVRTDPVRAPEGAGFATVFLALRGFGKAWFDDLEVKEVTRHVVLLDPLPGADVRDNTPAFTWDCETRVAPTLELSQDPAFPEAGTIRVTDVPESPARVSTPIAAGKWYWRASIPQWGYKTPTWDFNQTASLDEDTTEPQVIVEHGFLGDARTPVTVRYSDNVKVEKATVFVDGQEVTAQADVGEDSMTYAPADGWQPGLHKVRVQVEDAAGNQADGTALYTFSQARPRTVWELTGGVSVDGEKHFLLGMYGVRTEDIPRIAEAGFDFVHNYTWDGAGSVESAIEYLDEAQKYGMQAFIGLDRRKLIAGDEEFVAERVGALMDHPGLFAWYLFDEPDLTHQYVSPQWLGRYYRLIKTLDPYHPVIVTCAGDSAVSEFKDALDVHWTQVYGDTRRVATRIPKHRADLNPGTPVMAILHCYDRDLSSLAGGGKPVDLTAFQPDARLMRANAFMALASDSSCMAWWWFGQGSSSFVTVANAPEAWAGLTAVVRDLKSLEPVLTADGETQTWVEEPAEGVQVHFWEKKLQDRTVIIAVNADDTACEVRTKPRTVPGDAKLGVLFEDREVSLRDGTLTEQFDGLAVHVYEFVPGG